MKANEKQAVNAATGPFTEVLNAVQIKVGQRNKNKNQFIQVAPKVSKFFSRTEKGQRK